MKNEVTSTSSRNRLDTPLKEHFECDCVHCNNHQHKLMKDKGITRTKLPNGQWSKATACDVYEITCTLDNKIKGYIFTPYEMLEPNLCPMYPENQLHKQNTDIKLKKGKTSLLKRIFQSFF